MNEYSVIALVVLMVTIPFVLGWLAGTAMRWLDQSRCVSEALRARDEALRDAKYYESVAESLCGELNKVNALLIEERGRTSATTLRGLASGGGE